MLIAPDDAAAVMVFQHTQDTDTAADPDGLCGKLLLAALCALLDTPEEADEGTALEENTRGFVSRGLSLAGGSEN